VGTVRILHRAATISLQAAVHPKYTLEALNMKEEEEEVLQLDEGDDRFLHNVRSFQTDCIASHPTLLKCN